MNFLSSVLLIFALVPTAQASNTSTAITPGSPEQQDSCVFVAELPEWHCKQHIDAVHLNADKATLTERQVALQARLIEMGFEISETVKKDRITLESRYERTTCIIEGEATFVSCSRKFDLEDFISHSDGFSTKMMRGMLKTQITQLGFVSSTGDEDEGVLFIREQSQVVDPSSAGSANNSIK